MSTTVKMESRHTATHRLCVAAALVSVLQFSIVLDAQAAPLAGAFTGNARSLAAEAMGDALGLQLGTAAHVGCPCRGTNGAVKQNAVSSISVGPVGNLLTATETQATAYADKTASTAMTMQSDTVSNLTILNGMITADTLKAVASLDATPDTLTTSDAGTMVTNLVVAGAKIDPNVPNNTTLPLPGIGSVTIKATTVHNGKQKAHLAIEMLRIEVTQANSLGLPLGAKLIVAQAHAGYTRAQPTADLGGYAAGISVKGDVSSAVDESAGVGSGIGLPSCAGTGGQTLTKSVMNLAVPKFLTADTEVSTVLGGPVGAASVSKTTSTLFNVSLLGGLITAKSVAAVAQESRTGNVSTGSAAGSGFENLVVAGIPVVATAPNTIITVPTLGYITVNEQTSDAASTTLQVNGLHVVAEAGNLFGLPARASIVLAHAFAAASKF